MGAQARRERLAQLVAPILAEAGLDLEGLDITPVGKRRLVRVVVDSDDGVDLERDRARSARRFPPRLTRSTSWGSLPTYWR